MTHGNTTWPQEREDRLRQLYADGLSAGQIAIKLGLPTRNAVIGKVNRLGLTREKHNQQPGRIPKAQPRRTLPKPQPRRMKPKSDRALASYFAPTQPKLRPEPVDAQPIRVTIDQLTAASCRWPLGDPSDLDSFRYCGARVDLPSVVPYCGGHCRMAYARTA